MVKYKRCQVTKKQMILSCIIAGLLMLMASCTSSPNSEAPAENQVHEPGWAATHALSAQVDSFSCTSCHGSNYTGSNTVPSCFACHYDGPPFGIHPAAWVDAYLDHQAYADTNGISSCALSACHGASPFLQGGLTAPSCSSANFTNSDGLTQSCHAIHITGANWLLPIAHAAAAISDQDQCLGCHDMTTSGATPACRQCHVAANPFLVQGICSSCHNNPPDGNPLAGNIRPNLPGEHNKHVIGEGIGCASCHQGFGSGTLGHWYPDQFAPADVLFEATINLSYTGSNCTGDCHGENHNTKGAW